jgi:hypothetical protein
LYGVAAAIYGGGGVVGASPRVGASRVPAEIFVRNGSSRQASRKTSEKRDTPSICGIAIIHAIAKLPRGFDANRIGAIGERD